jgi:hypothetical protein
MKPIGIHRVPVAWPQDGTRAESDGVALANKYKEHGLNMLGEHATWNDKVSARGGTIISTEAGIIEMTERFKSGRLKVCKDLNMWFEEYREYHRQNGKIVKVRDDLMSATRIGMMMLRKAKPWSIIDIRARGRQNVRIVEGMDFPLT